MSSSASKKRKPNDDSQIIEEKIKKQLPDEIQRKIHLTQQFPHRIRSPKYDFLPEIDCGEFSISIKRIKRFKYRIHMESYATYGIASNGLNGAEKENFNTVLGNICRTIDQGFFNKTLGKNELWNYDNELWNYGIIEYDPQRDNSPFAGRSGPKRRLDILFTDTKGLPWTNCSWIYYHRDHAHLPEKIQDLLEKNIKFSILKKYNERTRNTVKLMETDTLSFGNFYSKRFYFKICKPKSSLRELIKKRLKKRTENTLLKF